jgi:hypothetical protein
MFYLRHGMRSSYLFEVESLVINSDMLAIEGGNRKGR